MAITCKIHTTELDDNAYILGEFNYLTAQHKQTRAIDGSFVVESFDRSADGEQITLTGMWLTRTTLNTVRTLANDSDATYTLTLPDSTTITVMFNTGNGMMPIKAQPIFPDANRASGQKFAVTLEFVKVS